jgi:hypothetical protein
MIASVDPGLLKMVLLFGGAAIVAVWGLWGTVRTARALAREKEADAARRAATPPSDRPGP